MIKNPLKWFKRWRSQRRDFKAAVERAGAKTAARRLLRQIENNLEQDLFDGPCAGCGRARPLGRTTVSAPLCMFTVKICHVCYLNLKELEARGGPEYIDTVGRLIQWGVK